MFVFREDEGWLLQAVCVYAERMRVGCCRLCVCACLGLGLGLLSPWWMSVTSGKSSCRRKSSGGWLVAGDGGDWLMTLGEAGYQGKVNHTSHMLIERAKSGAQRGAVVR